MLYFIFMNLIIFLSIHDKGFSSIRYHPTPIDHLVTRVVDLVPFKSNKERRANNLKISSIGKATIALTDVVAPARRQNRSISAI